MKSILFLFTEHKKFFMKQKIGLNLRMKCALPATNIDAVNNCAIEEFKVHSNQTNELFLLMFAVMSSLVKELHV